MGKNLAEDMSRFLPCSGEEGDADKQTPRQIDSSA
jgi:hypothetical protein